MTGALEFLREAGLGRPVKTGQDVLVIGGGNTASDAARSAIRLGGLPKARPRRRSSPWKPRTNC